MSNDTAASSSWQKFGRAAACAALAFLLAPAIRAQNPPAQTSSPNPSPVGASTDVTREQLQSFDNFIASHPEVKDALAKDPSLVDSPDYLKDHEALKKYFTDHPEIREGIKSHPQAFFDFKRQFEKSPDALTTTKANDRVVDKMDDPKKGNPAQRGPFNDFLAAHSDIRDELTKSPGMVNNDIYLNKHPELREFLASHPSVRDQLKANPRAFLNDNRKPDSHATPPAPADTGKNGPGEGEKGEDHWPQP
jgi:hypothetical protein